MRLNYKRKCARGVLTFAVVMAFALCLAPVTARAQYCDIQDINGDGYDIIIAGNCLYETPEYFPGNVFIGSNSSLTMTSGYIGYVNVEGSLTMTSGDIGYVNVEGSLTMTSGRIGHAFITRGGEAQITDSYIDGPVYIESGLFIMDGGTIYERVYVGDNGHIVMRRGGRMHDGVSVSGGGYFNMDSGEIFGVHISNGYFFMGGGYIYGGVSFNYGGYSSRGHFHMEEGYISGGVSVNGSGDFSMGGGYISGDVSVNGSGDFSMGGGYISGDVSVNGSGDFSMGGGYISGDVSVNDGSFTMHGGEIANNDTGVTVNGGSFTMYGGEIANNGTGVHVEGGVFTMYGGEIANNNHGVAGYGSFTMHGGKITNNDTGAFIDGGSFTMSGGEIVNNNHGVAGYGSFTMHGGQISGNRNGGVRGYWSLDECDVDFYLICTVIPKLTIGGDAVIRGNTPYNVFLEEQYYINISKDIPPTPNMEVWITKYGDGVVVSSDADDFIAQYFHADDNEKIVRHDFGMLIIGDAGIPSLVINVVSMPFKTTFFECEYFDRTGLVVTASYSGGNPIVIDDYWDYSVYLVKGAKSNSVSEYTFVIVYQGAVTSFPISVYDGCAPEYIEVTSLPDKMVYLIGDTLDLTGMVVTAWYYDGYSNYFTENITGYSTYPANGAQLNTAGEQRVTVSYPGVSIYFTIIVKEGHDCEFNGNLYLTLDEALKNIPDNTPTTIKLLGDIPYRIEIWGKEITFDLNGFELHHGFEARKDSKVTLTDIFTGDFYADGGAKVIVYGDVKGDIYAGGGAIVDVLGDVSCGDYTCWTQARGKDTVVSVGGKAHTIVLAQEGGKVEIQGDACGDDYAHSYSNSSTVMAEYGGIVTIGGDVYKDVWSGYGGKVTIGGNVYGSTFVYYDGSIYGNVMVGDGGTVTIDGALYVDNNDYFIMIGGYRHGVTEQWLARHEGSPSSDKPGYYEYTIDGTSRVWVKEVIQKIEVTTTHVKTTYIKGEALDFTGLVITATYGDGSKKTVAATDYVVTPANGAVLDTVGVQTVTVVYQGKHTAFTVIVNDIEPAGGYAYQSSGVLYSSLENALQNIPANEPATVTLLQDVNDPLLIEGKTVTLDLNGNEINEGIQASSGANVAVIGDVSGDIAASGEGTVVNVIGNVDGNVDAHGEGAVVDVTGVVSGDVFAHGEDTVVTVHGDVFGAIVASGDGTVVVAGVIHRSARMPFGRSMAFSDGGNVYGSVMVSTGGTVTINGTLYVENDDYFVMIDGQWFSKEDGFDSIIKPGYFEYTNGVSTVWVRGETFTVGFDIDGIVTNVTVRSGEAVVQPEDPVKEGFIFDGWRLGGITGAHYYFDAPVAGDVTLYAAWKQHKDEATILIKGIETGNGQVSLLFDINSANGKGYTIYLSVINTPGMFTPYNDVNFNSKGARVRSLNNGSKYYVYVEYKDAMGNISKSEIVEIAPEK